jgi:ComF family protein
MQIIPLILDFIIPRFCVSCGRKLKTGEQFICSNCFSQIARLSDKEIENEYNRKFNNSEFVSSYTALFNFEEGGKLQDLIHELKYNRKFGIGVFLGKILADANYDLLKKWDADLIIPIPLFHLKKIERGFNQSDYIAKGVAEKLGIPYYTATAKRIRNTPSQTKLNLLERTENMRDAFKIKKPSKIKGKKIIIVDDVITTGATVRELAKILKESGAKDIFALSVATPLHLFGSGNS